MVLFATEFCRQVMMVPELSHPEPALPVWDKRTVRRNFFFFFFLIRAGILPERMEALCDYVHGESGSNVDSFKISLKAV